MEPKFFISGAHFRRWLERHAGGSTELWVGYYKTGSGIASVTWPESVDQALCFGWIDGVRRSIDDERYMIRFTPRKPTSTWSAVNIERVEGLIAQGLMQPAGLTAYRARREKRSAIYSYERRPALLPEPYRSTLEADTRALQFFSAQPASYRRAAIWWIVGAKQERTRERRVARLIADSTQGRRLRQFSKR